MEKNKEYMNYVPPEEINKLSKRELGEVFLLICNDERFYSNNAPKFEKEKNDGQEKKTS